MHLSYLQGQICKILFLAQKLPLLGIYLEVDIEIDSQIHFNTYIVPYINIFIFLLSIDLPYATKTPGNPQWTFLCKRGSLSASTMTVPFISLVYRVLFEDFTKRQISTAYV